MSENLEYPKIDFLKLREKNGGFFDLPNAKRICMDSEHKPPTNLYIPPGKGYRHVCPSCGEETILIPPQITF